MNLSSNRKMRGAPISRELLYLSEESTKLENDVTNPTGLISCTWMIDNTSETGMYRVVIVASVADYESQTIIKTFNITRVS
jgi:hypothetical protein